MEISTEQTKEIRNYLSLKKLPLDVLAEVQDHFSTQILELQTNENMGFEEAFLKTKLLWKNELSFRKKSIFSFQKVPRLLYQLHDQQYKNLSKKALLFGFIFVLLQFSTVFLLEREHYFYLNVFVYTLSIIFVIAIVIYLIFSKMDKKRTMVEQFFDTEMTSLFIIGSFLSVFNFFGELSTNQFKVFYEFLHQTGLISIDEFFSATLMMFINVAVLSYIVLLLKTRAKAIKKVKNLVVIKSLGNA